MATKTVLSGLLCWCIAAPSCVLAGVNAWTPVGPDGGRVYDVEFSQTSPGIFYAVGRWGVYRSTVDSDAFELLKEDFARPPFDLAVDPTQADRVLVAGDGLQIGVGATWTRATSTFDQGAKVRTSRDGSTIYFAAGTRIFRSQDRGASWQERTPIPGGPSTTLVNALEIDPASSNVVYANSFGLGLFVSADGGGTWQRLGGNDPAIIHILNFVVDPFNPQRLLVATSHAGLRISNDGGSTWNATTVTNQIWDVDVDPLDPRIIYVSGPDIRKSEDDGATWQVLPVDQPLGSLRLVIDPAVPSRLAAFNGEGVSVSKDAGKTWAKRVAGLRGTNSTGFSPLPSSRRNYFSVRDRGVYYLDAGESLARSVNNDPLVLLAAPPGDLFGIRVLALPGNPDTLYAILNSQVLAQSLDGGLHWTKLPSPTSFINDLAASPLEPRTLYAGGSPGVYKSLDGGATWAASAAGLPDQLAVVAIAIASTPATLYAIGAVSDAAPGAPAQWRIYRSGDSAVTWAPASPVQSPSFVSVTVDPNDPQVVYGGFGSELRKSTDGGGTWDTVTRNGLALCCDFGGVVFDPADSNVFYAQHRQGVWRTVDAGASWERVPPPFQTAYTDSGDALALDPENRHRLLMGWTELGVRELTIAPDLELTMTAPAALGANTPANYALTVRNSGPFDATQVRVTAQLPAGATAAAAGATGARCTLAATMATCVFDVVRASAGAAAISLSFVPASIPVTLSASVTGDQPDSLSSNNAASRTIAAAAPPTSGGGGGAISLAFLAALGMLSLVRPRLTRH